MAEPPPGPPNYPPPPPGAAYPAPPPGAAPIAPAPYAADPYAAQRAVEQWAASRGYTLGMTPDPAWYQAWKPFVYLFHFTRVGRELRGVFQDTGVFLVEAYDPDPLKQASGADCALCGFITSPRLACRAAIRSKLGGGVMNELKSGLGALFSQPSQGSVLGDPTFEARFDVSAPSRDDAHRALPVPLRQQLLGSGWQGIIEIRPGGLLCTAFGQCAFEPQTLEAAHSALGQIFALATG
jgi:hypothetical protein